MKKNIFVLIILASFFLLWLSYNKIVSVGPQIKNDSVNNTLSVNQVIGGIKKSYKTSPGITALGLLEKTNYIITNGEKENAFVVSINKIKADSFKNQYWAFYINGKPSNVGAGSYHLQQNDNIEWKIEKY